MNIVRLSDIERVVLGAVQLAPLLTASDVAERVGLSVRSVQGALQRLRARGVVGSPKAAIDRAALGSMTLRMLYALTRIRSHERKALMQYIKQAQVVQFAAEIGGRWQISLSVSCGSAKDGLVFMHEFASRFGRHLHSQEIALQATFSMFPRKYFGTPKNTPKSVEYGRPRISTTLDDTDYAILEVLSEARWESFRAVASRLKLAPATVLRRVAALQEIGVIAGFYLPVNASMLRQQIFALFIYCSSQTAQLTSSLHEWCRNHTRVTGLAVAIGAWQFEVVIEVNHSSEAQQISQQLLDEFAEQITRIESVPFFDHVKASKFQRLSLS